jgi:hypothetical protein
MGKRETGGHGEQPTGDLYVDALTKRNSLKAKMSRERVEIPVVVQQTQAFFDTKGGNEAIDGGPDGDVSTAQQPIVACRLNCHGAAAELQAIQLIKRRNRKLDPGDRNESRAKPQPGSGRRQAASENLLSERSPRTSLQRWNAPKVSDPNAGIH